MVVKPIKLVVLKIMYQCTSQKVLLSTYSITKEFNSNGEYMGK